MVLSRGDDYPIHQTPEPVAFAGTDRNFYDRYFFNGYAPDGSGFFAVALGIYPHLDIIDAHFNVVRDGVQHCVHASAELGMERMAMAAGPISVEIIEALNILRIRLEPFENMAADITFTGRAFPIEEPRFTHRIGPRAFMDYTRLTQNGGYEGWIEVDGDKQDLAAGTMGTRDRSWGVRPIGARDTQPMPGRRYRASSGNGPRSTSPAAACSSTSITMRRAMPGTRAPHGRARGPLPMRSPRGMAACAPGSNRAPAGRRGARSRLRYAARPNR